MPKLADLGIAEIKMYYKDHDPPHIHAFHAEGVVKLAVENLDY